ncbi:MAG: hypothetical protein LBJ31_09970 [Treponema sp.]|jgi:hypothetical protein|nr:hypothetical protein [Treponema sp.]
MEQWIEKIRNKILKYLSRYGIFASVILLISLLLRIFFPNFYDYLDNAKLKRCYEAQKHALNKINIEYLNFENLYFVPNKSLMKITSKKAGNKESGNFMYKVNEDKIGENEIEAICVRWEKKNDEEIIINIRLVY